MKNSQSILMRLSLNREKVGYRFERLHRIFFMEDMYREAFVRIMAREGKRLSRYEAEQFSRRNRPVIKSMIENLKRELPKQEKWDQRFILPSLGGKIHTKVLSQFAVLSEIASAILQAIGPQRQGATLTNPVKGSSLPYQGRRGHYCYWNGTWAASFLCQRRSREKIIPLLREHIDDERFLRLLRKLLKQAAVHQRKPNRFDDAGLQLKGCIAEILQKHSEAFLKARIKGPVWMHLEGRHFMIGVALSKTGCLQLQKELHDFHLRLTGSESRQSMPLRSPRASWLAFQQACVVNKHKFLNTQTGISLRDFLYLSGIGETKGKPCLNQWRVSGLRKFTCLDEKQITKRFQQIQRNGSRSLNNPGSYHTLLWLLRLSMQKTLGRKFDCSRRKIARTHPKLKRSLTNTRQPIALKRLRERRYPFSGEPYTSRGVSTVRRRVKGKTSCANNSPKTPLA